MRLIDADALYERACSLEAQALDYVGKLIERDGDEVSVEWKIWSAILTERTAFKHDVFDAPTIEPRCETCEAFNKTRLLIPQPERKTGKWIRGDAEKLTGSQRCSICHKACYKGNDYFNYCPNCGAKMER